MWITLIPDDLAGSLTAAEVAKVTAIGGNGDIAPGLIEEVVGEVRGYAATAGALGAAGTIPDELKRAAVSVIVWRYVTSIPTDKLATQARKDANERAVALFRDVAAGKFRVVAPETAAPATQQVNRPTIATIEPGNSGMSRDALRRL